MPIKLKLYPYKLGSASAKELATSLNIKRLRANGNYHHYSNHIIINWGNSSLPYWHKEHLDSNWINHPSSVRLATNKLVSFKVLETNNVSIPILTTDPLVAKTWLEDSKIIVCRKTLTGHSGSGIVIARSEEEIVSAPLYTQHVRHTREFRVHIFNGNVIDASEKKRRNGVDASTLVRSYDNGWVFTRENLVVPEDVLLQSINAVEALGLDFGAVDVGYRVDDDKAFIFEVNSAPGLVGTTLIKYSEEFTKCLNTN